MSGRSGPRRSRKTKTSADTWKASADAPLQALIERADTPPLLAQAIQAVPWQTRTQTPFGRVVTAPGSRAEVLAALLALRGSVVSDSDAAAGVPIEGLLDGNADMAPFEIRLTLAGQLWGSASVARTPADTPIVAAFAVVRIAGDQVELARIALTGVWSQPARLAESAARLTGQALTEEALAATAAAVAEECSPPSNYLGSEEYRRAMSAVTTARALAACAERIA